MNQQLQQLQQIRGWLTDAPELLRVGVIDDAEEDSGRKDALLVQTSRVFH